MKLEASLSDPRADILIHYYSLEDTSSIAILFLVTGFLIYVSYIWGVLEDL